MTFARILGLLAGSLGTRIGGAVLGLLTQFILARNLPPDEVGTIFLTMSTAAIACLIVTAGYPTLALTELPRLQYQNRARLLRSFHGAFLRDWLMLTALYAVIIFMLLWFLPLPANLKLALALGSMSAPASSFLRYFGSLANSRKLYALSQIPDSIVRPGLFLLYILVRFAVFGEPGLLEILAAFVVANTLTAVVNHFAFGSARLPISSWHDADTRYSKVLRSRALPLIVVSGITTMFADIVTLLGGFLMPAADVAILGLTIRLAAIAGFAIQTAQQFALPDLATAITSRDRDGEVRLLGRLNGVTLAVVVAGLIAVIILGKWLLSWFGTQYTAGAGLLVMFMIAQSVRAFSGMNQHLLSIAGFQMRTAGACLAALAILCSVWLLLSGGLGLYAVGVAVIAAEIAWGIILAVQSQTLTGRRGDFLWILSRWKSQ